MQDLLRGKTALITGGSRGIGRAIALGLATHGATVVVGYLKNEDRAREVVKTIADADAGGKAAAVKVDLSRPTEVISPGPTDTDMMQDRYRDKAAGKSPFNRIGDPREVADVAVFLATDAARWLTGQNIGAGGGAF